MSDGWLLAPLAPGVSTHRLPHPPAGLTLGMEQVPLEAPLINLTPQGQEGPQAQTAPKHLATLTVPLEPRPAKLRQEAQAPAPRLAKRPRASLTGQGRPACGEAGEPGVRWGRGGPPPEPDRCPGTPLPSEPGWVRSREGLCVGRGRLRQAQGQGRDEVGGRGAAPEHSLYSSTVLKASSWASSCVNTMAQSPVGAQHPCSSTPRAEKGAPGDGVPGPVGTKSPQAWSTRLPAPYPAPAHRSGFQVVGDGR